MMEKWNFWTPIQGTVYVIYERKRFRKRTAYIGKTMQVPWTKRIEDHLWGRYHRDSKKDWAHLVPGYETGTVEGVIAAGGVRTPFRRRTVPMVLFWIEVLNILLRFPVRNKVWNTRNPRRINKSFRGSMVKRGRSKIRIRPVWVIILLVALAVMIL